MEECWDYENLSGKFVEPQDVDLLLLPLHSLVSDTLKKSYYTGKHEK